MRTRLCTVLASLVIIAAVRGAEPDVPASAPAGWQAYPVGSVDGVAVGVVVKKDASLADEEFLMLTLENTTEQAVALARERSYRVDYSASDAATGKTVPTGKQVIGGSDDLLQGCVEDPRADTPELEPGMHQNARHPSVYTAMALGHTTVPLRIKGTVHVTLGVKGGEGGKAAEMSCPIEFTWNPLSKDEIAQALKRLKQVLVNPEEKGRNCSLYGGLMNAPEMVAAVPVKDLLAALGKHIEASSDRSSIVSYLSRHYSDKPEVVDYYAKRLAASDQHALSDLMATQRDAGREQEFHAIWDDRYVPLLVKYLEGLGKEFGYTRQVLRLLDAHPGAWKDNAEVREALCRHLLKEFPEIKGPPEKLGAEDVLEFLAVTREPKMVPVLTPYLSDKRVVRDYKRDALIARGSFPTPQRMCDIAYNAIRSCQGRPEEGFKLEPVRVTDPFVAGRSEATIKEELAERDRVIEKLRGEIKGE